MRRSAILGTGFCVPDRVVTNDDLAGLMDTSDQWIRERTGIEERRWVREGQSSVDLALPAAQQALEAAGLQPTDLDAIVFATSTPDHFCPGNGVYLQRSLGAGNIPALDIRTQCSGFVYGLSVADAWIRSGQYDRILLVGEEIQSTGMDLSTEGRHTAVIFADGAGAAILGAVEESEDRGVLCFDLHTDGDFAEKLWVDVPGSMYHPRISARQLEAGEAVAHDGWAGCLPTCRDQDAGIGDRGRHQGGVHLGRREPPDSAPGQPADLRGGAEIPQAPR